MSTKEFSTRTRASSPLDANQQRALLSQLSSTMRAISASTRKGLDGARWLSRLTVAIRDNRERFTQACGTADALGGRGHLASHPLSRRTPA